MIHSKTRLRVLRKLEVKFLLETNEVEVTLSPVYSLVLLSTKFSSLNNFDCNFSVPLIVCGPCYLRKLRWNISATIPLFLPPHSPWLAPIGRGIKVPLSEARSTCRLRGEGRVTDVDEISYRNFCFISTYLSPFSLYIYIIVSRSICDSMDMFVELFVEKEKEKIVFFTLKDKIYNFWSGDHCLPFDTESSVKCLEKV